MSFFKRLFGGKGDDASPPTMPWDRKPSILDFIRAHTVPGQPGIAESGYRLPDDNRINQGSQIRWAAGAMDGVLTHHMGGAEEDKRVRRIVKLVLAYSNQPTAQNKAAVYTFVIKENVVSIIDPVIEALAKNTSINEKRLYELAHSFVTDAPDREPVKFGIAILGLFRQPDDEEFFQALGRHEEFTLFCAVAISNLSDDPDDSLWTLAKNVDGWGRIHTVERLSKTTRPEIKRWLLREGYRNSIMNEYLAATCARAGELLAALSEDRVDRELLTAAGEIIQALIAGGPAEGIDDYDDARPALEHFLRHMQAAAQTVQDFVHVHAIKSFLDEDDESWIKRYGATTWSSEGRSTLLAACEAILSRSEWPDRVRRLLRSDDDMQFARADQAAKVLGIETWDIHWQRLQTKPLDAGRWFQVMTRCDEDRVAKVIAFAEKSLDLAAIATGPRNDLGVGPGFEQHSCLDFVLQDLRRFPGRGDKLIQTGLRSPAIRNRHMAIAALAACPRGQWPDGLERALKAAVREETDGQVKEQMRKALKGEPLE